LEPTVLNDNINYTQLARYPSVSPDGRRLYFTDWRNGEWDFYYSDLDDTTHDWGPAKNMGYPINNWDYEWVCHQVDSRRFYFHRTGGSPWLSLWDSASGWWGMPSRLDTLHFLGIDDGISVTRNGKKIYQGIFTSTFYSDDLYVSYYDSTHSQWSFPKRLNISVMMDTTADPYRHVQAFPSIIPDGKQIYFIGTLGGPGTIWTSTLLIDEDGNPVGVENRSRGRPSRLKLYQNFPNPFNPETTIMFELPEREVVTIIIYDVLGRRVETLFEGTAGAGLHQTKFTSSVLSSGIYFCRLTSPKGVMTKTMFLVR
jgi:hypothetical protein